MRHVILLGSLGIVIVSLAACAQSQEADSSCSGAGSAIVGGTTASAYAEAALVDLYQGGQLYGYCSGSLIAPQVVLTAGHCVDGMNGWKVKLPFANNQTATASGGETYDWHENGATTVNPAHHDIGLVYLSTPLTLTTFPALAQQPIAAGTSIVNIGRIKNGTLSTTSLFVSASIQVEDGATYGYDFDYAANDVIQEGDSGGPDELVSGGTHTIVAVNSGGGQNLEVLARVDLLYSWIQTKINAHGGNGNGSSSSSSSGGSSSGGSSSGGSSSGSGSSSSSSGGGSSSSSGGGSSSSGGSTSSSTSGGGSSSSSSTSSGGSSSSGSTSSGGSSSSSSTSSGGSSGASGGSSSGGASTTSNPCP